MQSEQNMRRTRGDLRPTVAVWRLGVSALLLTTLAAASCEDAPGTGTGGGGRTSSSGGQGGASGGSPAGPPARLGMPCTDSAECDPTGYCIPATMTEGVFVGAPARGYCSHSCAVDADCGPEGYCEADYDACLLRCALDEPALQVANDPLDPSKCWGREDLACYPAPVGGGACYPLCGRDAQCEPGLSCDPRYGTCREVTDGGLSVGQPCDDGEDCAGLCMVGEGYAFCTRPCLLGGDLLETHDCGGPDEGSCYFEEDGAGGVGDLAWCTARCFTQDDCYHPYLWCWGIDYFSRGYCAWPLPCPNGASDCAALPAGYGFDVQCVETAHGPYCVDLAFDLGSAGLGGGGAAGGGAGGGGSGGMAGSPGAGGLAGAPGTGGP